MNVKKIRYAMGYTQPELAKKLGISISTMVKYEKDGEDISKIQDKLEVLIKEKKLYHLIDKRDNDKVQKILMHLDAMYDKIRGMICETM